MRILRVKVLKDSDHSVRTALLTILNKDGEERDVYVETIDGVYRENKGCTIYSVNEGLSRIKLNKDEFNDYKINIKRIIIEAEKHVTRAIVADVPGFETASVATLGSTLTKDTLGFALRLIVFFLFACVILVAEYMLVVFPFALWELNGGERGFFSLFLAFLWGAVVFLTMTYYFFKTGFLEFCEKMLDKKINPIRKAPMK